MVEIKEVKSKRDFKKFVKFPVTLYKDSVFYVPPMEQDEFNLTNPKKNASFEESEAVYFLAYRDGKIVGRIAGIISHAYNEKNHAKRARFSRFDLIDDAEVAKALFDAVENWARSKGMLDIHGPLGFNDLEREGLMVYGFNTIGTFQGSCNAEYYQKHVEANGYKPDAKWVEWRIPTPEKVPDKLVRAADVISRRYGFYEGKFKNKKEIIDGYGYKFFELLDECFAPLYGTIPFSKKLVDQTIGLFNLVINPDYVSIIFDKDGEMAGFGVGYPSLAKAMQKCKGRLLPFGWIGLLKAIQKPESLELGLIAVKPKYQNHGVTALIIKNMLDRFIKHGIKYADTGSQLETNVAVINALDMFDRELVRRKTCYLKSLSPEAESQAAKPEETAKIDSKI